MTIETVARPRHIAWFRAAVAAAAVLAILSPLVWAARNAERLTAPDGALAPLSFVLEPYLELLSQASGTTWGSGEHEYVIFLADEGERGARERFFAGHPEVRLVRQGDLPDSIVVAIAPPIGPAVAALRDQPFVGLMLNNRGAFVCH